MSRLKRILPPANNQPVPENQNPQPIGGGELGDTGPSQNQSPQVLYTLYFRTSHYPTFLAKASDLFTNLTYSQFDNLIPIETNEPF